MYKSESSTTGGPLRLRRSVMDREAIIGELKARAARFPKGSPEYNDLLLRIEEHKVALVLQAKREIHDLARAAKLMKHLGW
jgi:hypothetical protein